MTAFNDLRTIVSPAQGWKVYNSVKPHKYAIGAPGAVCAYCGTIHLYGSGIEWASWYTLVQDMAITAIAKCAKCGAWNQAGS